MGNEQETIIDKTLGISASIVLLIIGFTALLTGMDAVASILLIMLGIGGILLVYKIIK